MKFGDRFAGTDYWGLEQPAITSSLYNWYCRF